MAVKLFILGLPGSGKSTVARYIKAYTKKFGWSTTRFNDYLILQNKFLADSEHKQFKPAEFGGFDVLNLKVFDEALHTLEQEVKEHIDALKPGAKELVLIEFSRNNYNHAFCQFNRSFLEGAYVLYLGAEVKVCKHRIRDRIDNPQFEEDDFNVSDYIFEKYYSADDGACLVDVLENYGVDRWRIWALDNSYSYETACMKVETFIQQILEVASQEEADNPKDSPKESIPEIDAHSPQTSLDESAPSIQAESEFQEATSEKQLADVGSRS